MNATTARHLQKINVRAERVLDEMSLHEPPVLRRPPAKGAWTPLQVLHHVNLVERTSVDYLLYKFGTLEQDPPGLRLSDRLRGKLVALSLMSPLKFKAPEAVNSPQQAPANNLNLDELAFSMRTTRNELKDLLDQLPTSWYKTAAFRHGVAGRMSINDMLVFMRVHQDRHIKQIRRGLAQNARYYRRQETG